MIKLLNSEQKLTPTSVEELIMKPMKDALNDPSKCRELDQELVEFLINIQMAEMVSSPSIADAYNRHLNLDWRLQAIKKRIENCFQYKMTPAAMMLFGVLASDYPIGAWIMFITYLQYYCKQEGHKEITSQLLCMAFKNGLLIDEVQKEIWYSTKVVDTEHCMSSDNLIDYPRFYESIMFD